MNGMMNGMMAGFFVFFAAMVASRFINERGIRSLSQDEKARMVDGFASQRKWQIVPVIILLWAFLAVLQFAPGASSWALAAYFVALAAWAIVAFVLNLRRFRSLALPGSMIKAWILGRLVVAAGFVCLMVGFLRSLGHA